ncbi:MAG: hypothetical protein JO076_17655, partial [Verrucomicrobia bacterium]|nr:hypothetical protein [Verrucomicrobiota bacterium]
MNSYYVVRSNFPAQPRIKASPAHLMLKSLSVILAICSVTVAGFSQNRYQVIRIPTPEGANSAALGINNKGEVVGYSFQGDDYRAFLYSPADQSLTDVGSFGGKINAACAINDSGQITGYSQDRNGNLLAFISSPKQQLSSLGTLGRASTSEAFAINDNGAVVGDSQSGNQSHLPVLFSAGMVQDLGIEGASQPDALETAYSINDAGQIVGRHSAENNTFHAFMIANGKIIDFPTLGGANGEALAINQSGVVVGDSDTRDGSTHAFVLEHSRLKDLGTLPDYTNASYARGINKAGDIVGESDSANQKRAFLYTKGHLVQLDKLTENLSETGLQSLDVAYSINDKGWIVGYGTTSDNLSAAFLAMPETQDEQMSSAQDQLQYSDQGEQASNEGDYNVFYSRLSSDEGNWVQAGNYGYCFRPRVSEHWRPYQDGHWIWTDHGWYWSSNEPFGWATYHYGRWVDINGTGWCWVPGKQWAPAWVSWRQSDENVGWAPLPPEAEVYPQTSISSWSDSYYGIGPAAYIFLNYSHWHERNYAQFVEPPSRNVQIINESRNVTNIVTTNNIINNYGPPVQTVEEKTNRSIQQVKLALSSPTTSNANFGQSLQGNQLKVIAPPATLQSRATQAPPVQNRIVDPQVEKGWQGVKPQEQQKLKRVIAEQNPIPGNLPKPAPFVQPQIGSRAQGTGLSRTAGSEIAGHKPPANTAVIGSPHPVIAPGASPNAAAAGNRSVPANLLGAKSVTAPGSPVKAPGGRPVTPGRQPEIGNVGVNGKAPVNGNVPAGVPASPGAPPNGKVAGRSLPANLLGTRAEGTAGNKAPLP